MIKPAQSKHRRLRRHHGQEHTHTHTHPLECETLKSSMIADVINALFALLASTARRGICTWYRADNSPPCAQILAFFSVHSFSGGNSPQSLPLFPELNHSSSTFNLLSLSLRDSVLPPPSLLAMQQKSNRVPAHANRIPQWHQPCSKNNGRTAGKPAIKSSTPNKRN